MHELWIARRILTILDQQKACFDHQRLKSVLVEIGELIAIEPSSLLFSFDVIKKNSIAESATLFITLVLGQAWCDHCQKKSRMPNYFATCPICQQMLSKIIQGESIHLKNVEVYSCVEFAAVNVKK